MKMFDEEGNPVVDAGEVIRRDERARIRREQAAVFAMFEPEEPTVTAGYVYELVRRLEEATRDD